MYADRSNMILMTGFLLSGMITVPVALILLWHVHAKKRKELKALKENLRMRDFYANYIVAPGSAPDQTRMFATMQGPFDPPRMLAASRDQQTRTTVPGSNPTAAAGAEPAYLFGGTGHFPAALYHPQMLANASGAGAAFAAYSQQLPGATNQFAPLSVATSQTSQAAKQPAAAGASATDSKEFWVRMPCEWGMNAVHRQVDIPTLEQTSLTSFDNANPMPVISDAAVQRHLELGSLEFRNLTNTVSESAVDVPPAGSVAVAASATSSAASSSVAAAPGSVVPVVAAAAPSSVVPVVAAAAPSSVVPVVAAVPGSVVAAAPGSVVPVVAASGAVSGAAAASAAAPLSAAVNQLPTKVAVSLA